MSPKTSVRFPLRLRIPAWANGATVRINGQLETLDTSPETFALIDRIWVAGDTVDLHLPMIPSVSRWFNHSLALMRGPIVFSFDPGQSWVKLRDRGLTADWQVYPQRPWNYALLVEEKSAARIDVVESPIGLQPFAARGAAVRLRLKGRLINAWRSEDGVAGLVPNGLQSSDLLLETLELIPYAAAKLRITAFPQLRPEDESGP